MNFFIFCLDQCHFQSRSRYRFRSCHTFVSDSVFTFVLDPSPVLKFGLGPAFASDPGPVLDSASYPVFNSDSATSHRFDEAGGICHSRRRMVHCIRNIEGRLAAVSQRTMRRYILNFYSAIKLLRDSRKKSALQLHTTGWEVDPQTDCACVRLRLTSIFHGFNLIDSFIDT
ncbi:hypothetical protein EVAR_56778_1 [Eumeta japonica]|uniref:Uncharacterized protein n=1 Tax=Eumeta variegata TaxID=151549 RepID=A0A4C1XLH0_EUMVA|nr:hypothetical protein EVAR_56778_1 [Eumeta japonica]